MKHKIFITAGESSGDLIGAKLIRSLKEINSDIEFSGVGGPKMEAENFQSIFPIQDISIIGFAEVLPKLPLIFNRLKLTVNKILESQPDIIITIDSPGFNFALAKRVRAKLGKKVKMIHYVAPSVWAYKPERVHKVAALYDHLILILPFEKPYFDAVGLPSTFVGHPVVENSKEQVSPDIYEKYQLNPDDVIIPIMPGSRAGEIKKHMPIFLQALSILQKKIPNIRAFILTLPHLYPLVKSYVNQENVEIITDEQTKWQLISIASVAFVKSGTSSVELMQYKLPMVVAYKLPAVSSFLIKRMIRVKYATLCNLVLDKAAIPELLLDKCTPQNIADALHLLIMDKEQQNDQKRFFDEALNQLGQMQQEKPSQIAAKLVIDILNGRDHGVIS